MGPENQENRYLFLREDIQPPVCAPGISLQDHERQITAWYRHLNREQKALHAMLTGQVLGLLGVTSDQQIQSLIASPELREAASNRMVNQLGLVYGIRGSERIRQKLEDYGNDADLVIDFLQSYLSYPGCINLEMVNEVRASNDPTDLLLRSLDGSWTPKARFDAKRKLQLMNLAANIDRRERELKIEDQFKRFVNWMGRLWNPELPHGESQGVFLVSTHDPETWACTKTEWVTESKGAELHLQPFQKKTHLPRRSFKTDTGRIIDAYITTREKTRMAKILKMLRKGQEDPAIAVDDDTGLLVVVRDTRSFIQHLINQGYRSNYPIIIEDTSYTLDGKDYKGNHGSSPRLRMMKFFVRLADEMRIECIIHTPETYAESLYMRGVSRGEYELNRLFESGVLNLLFREKYHPYFDMDEAKRWKQTQVRADIEGMQMAA